MRKFLTSILEKVLESLKKTDNKKEILRNKEVDAQSSCLESHSTLPEEIHAVVNTIQKKKSKEISHKTIQKSPVRDIMNLMDSPFLALSKKRKEPIIYESKDGTCKTVISAHSKHYLASIYDWDIIIFVAGKIQEIINNMSDIPPRTITIPRHEILKALHKHNVNTQQRELENSLHRLKRTAIDTTICNEDGRYKSDFGFIDSWDYTERKDKKEIRITLSQWLYDLICTKGALLKVDNTYFEITSGIKKFLYRTARKCVGYQDSLEFSINTLYKKSGSESSFRLFKSKLKNVVIQDNLPEYSVTWSTKGKIPSVIFSKRQTRDILENTVEKFELSRKKDQ